MGGSSAGNEEFPTIRQWFVDQALFPWRQNHCEAIVYHYMDDILIATKEELPSESEQELICQLNKWGLTIAPEKVQRHAPWAYLGTVVTETHIRPQKMKITKTIHTVNDVQQLVGDIRWLHVYGGITNEETAPLLELLKNAQYPGEERKLTREAELALHHIEKRSAQHRPTGIKKICLSKSLYITAPRK